MDKVTLKELYDDVFRRSSLISIPNLSEMLVVPGSAYSRWEIFAQIVRDALDKFEYYYPLTLNQKMYIEVDDSTRIAKYFPNFDSFLEGILDEDSIVLDISACSGLSYYSYINSGYPLRNFSFNNGQFLEFWYPTGVYWGNCICKRPFIEEFIRGDREDQPTDRCAVYFLKRNSDSQWTIFRDQLFVSLCRYLLSIKKNIAYTNLPIDLFGGLEEDLNKVESKLDSIYSEALKWSAWLM